MLTPDQMKEHSFTLVENGRYSAEEVNRYFGEVIASYNQMYRENGELIRKISILANKVQDYRRDEDNIRNALLNAQRASERILADAQKQADGIVEAANKEMLDIVDGRDGIVTKANTDAESIVNNARIKAENIIATAMQQAEEIDFSAKAAAGEAESNAQEHAEKILSDANSEAMGILAYAKQEAEKISGDANAAADEIRAAAEREKAQRAADLDQSASGMLADAQKQAQEILDAATEQAKVLRESADAEAKQKNADCEMQLREIRAKIAAAEERLSVLCVAITAREAFSGEGSAENVENVRTESSELAQTIAAERIHADENSDFDDFSADEVSCALPSADAVLDENDAQENQFAETVVSNDVLTEDDFTGDNANSAFAAESEEFDSFDDFSVDETVTAMGVDEEFSDGETRIADDFTQKEPQSREEAPLQASARQVLPDEALQNADSDKQTNFVVHVNTDDFGEYHEEEMFDDFGSSDETNAAESFDAQSDDFASFDDSLISNDDFMIDFSLFDDGVSAQEPDEIPAVQEDVQTEKSNAGKKSRRKKNKKKK